MSQGSNGSPTLQDLQQHVDTRYASPTQLQWHGRRFAVISLVVLCRSHILKIYVVISKTKINSSGIGTGWGAMGGNRHIKKKNKQKNTEEARM